MNLKIKVYGVVQGVGYRPFAQRLAKKLGLAGNVRNQSGIVIINITGVKEALDEYVRRLTLNAPEGSIILHVVCEEIPDVQTKDYVDGFKIVSSDASPDGSMPILPPDLATCERCRSEMYDENNRRFLHPFISCTSCGPRYSIIKDIPYDRENIAMSKFEMCDDCNREYTLPDDIRCHAQTVACHECGPELTLDIYDEIYEHSNNSNLLDGDGISNTRKNITKLDRTAEIINAGGIVALKNIGGYHFVCRADNEDALIRLRELKHRQNKAFAVMFSSAHDIETYAYVDETEKKCLLEKARPIVLLKKRDGRDFPENVCGDSSYLGAFLPSDPLQIYLTGRCGALVMTSGNLGGEPIIIDDLKMKQLVMAKGIISAVLSHNREILTPLDDSIVRVFDGKRQMIRRAKGYVPLPLFVDRANNCKDVIFASGGDLKASFCYMKNGQAVMSQYFGDLDDCDASGAWKQNIKRVAELHGLVPQILACDLHPRYYSAQIAKGLYKYEKVMEIQHHHAHIASVIAEHNLNGKVLGFAFDGTGYGTDGIIWGGEALVCEGSEYERTAHLETVAMCGADEIAKDADMALMCYLIQAGVEPGSIFDLKRKSEQDKLAIIKGAIRFGVGLLHSSSMGRLFDAICALLNIRHYNSHEGECAAALEKAASQAKTEEVSRIKIKLELTDGIWRTSSLIRQLIAIKDKYNTNSVAAAFHYAVADAVVDYAVKYKVETGEKPTIALSGGVFMNRLLTERIIGGLQREGFMVYLNEDVPMNDGGIALGQAYIAAMKERS